MDSLSEPFEVIIDERALKELDQATRKNKALCDQLAGALRSLSTDWKTTVKRMVGMKPALYRKRVENWHIIFAMSAKLKQIRVFAVRKRESDTYDQSELKRFARQLSADFDDE